MDMDGLPTPPNEELVRSQGLKKTHAVSKSIKTVHRTLKRTTPHGHPPSPSRDNHSIQGDGRHKRVWKACERCRMKKTKCDGEFPCKRCKDDGLICTAGVRKKTEYKQLPPGYAEVLENTQFVLVATVQKLYTMLRNGEKWELGDPELNDRGLPIVHNVASKLGCLRPNSDMDLPTHSIFPEDEAGMVELARQLHDQAGGIPMAELRQAMMQQETESNSGSYLRTDRASSSAASDAEHSDLDLDTDYRRAAFGAANSAVSMSPASLHYTDFDVSPSAVASSEAAFPPPPPPPSSSQQQSPGLPAHPNTFSWISRPPSMDFAAQQQMWMTGQGYMDAELMSSGVLASSPFAVKPQGFSPSCRNPEVMMGMGDPMIYAGYEEDPLRPLFPN